MRTVAVMLSLLPVLAAAQGSNPFKPGTRAEPAASVFAPAPVIPPSAVIPPPLPPPERETGSPKQAAVMSTPKPAQAPKSCAIAVSPSAPLLGAQGGDFVLRIQEGPQARDCIAGIESRESWLKIQHFNGRELTLYAEPNRSSSVRRGEVLFANAANSLSIRIVQAAQ